MRHNRPVRKFIQNPYDKSFYIVDKDVPARCSSKIRIYSEAFTIGYYILECELQNQHKGSHRCEGSDYTTIIAEWDE